MDASGRCCERDKPMIRLVVTIFLAGACAQGQAPIPDLTSAQKTEALRLLAEVRANARGPYGTIHWYCRDGRVLPVNTRCGGKGGFQHASPSPSAQRLAELNFDVAQLLAGTPFDQFFDEKRNHFGLREIVAINYLTNRADGWIYKKTYARRGVRQSEDEDAEGLRLLGELLSRHEWVSRNYLLAMLVTANTSHGVDNGRLREIRALSASLAAAEPAFQPLRGKIHSKPDAGDVARVEQFVREKKPADQAGFEKLLQLMRAEYAEAETAANKNFEGGADRSMEIRRILSAPGGTGKERLALADEQLDLQQRAFLHKSSGGSRKQSLLEMRTLLKYATGGGILSTREFAALDEKLQRLAGQQQIDARQYAEALSYVEGGAEWAHSSVARELGEVQHHYAQIEPLAEGLIDDVLRSSPLLPLASDAELLTRDADRVAGRRHQLLDLPGKRGVRGLNPGLALARLEIISDDRAPIQIQPDRIYIIPATLADLKPMKGILTLDSGNALSHAQLLAANLGIPNATIPSGLLPELRKYRGQEMFYAVTQSGTVVLRRWSALSPAEQASWRKTMTNRQRITLDTARVNLNDRALKTLTDTTSADSGVRCGPKAANLGQLRRFFPDHVAQGIVVPFGVYWAHVSRRDARGGSLADRIHQAYEEAEKMRASGRKEEEIRVFIAPKLADFRQAIRTITLDPAFVKDLNRKLEEVFGKDGSYGVFVRSDTNAEDLPQFTGAGLNLTVPNVVGAAKIQQALRDVWASPFEERAYAWRSQALTSSDRVYPSVVLYRTIRSDKSGVMATANLATLDLSGITVNVNEGVAAVVDGGVSESLLLEANGKVQLLAQARAPYRKVGSPGGGFVEKPTTGSDTVLTDAEIAQLRKLARDVKAKFPPQLDQSGATLPWDIEFGFENGDLRLFQIRPLVRYREARILEALGSLEGPQSTAQMVPLDRPPQAQ
jgi:rifampicin phosphotransferase